MSERCEVYLCYNLLEHISKQQSILEFILLLEMNQIRALNQILNDQFWVHGTTLLPGNFDEILVIILSMLKVMFYGKRCVKLGDLPFINSYMFLI